MMTLDVVLLAAGLSQRMGRNKLLMTIDGEPLVRRSARVTGHVANRLFVVLGHDADRVRQALADLPVILVENPHVADGQQSSVTVGLRAAGTVADAVMIGLADQPLLTADDLGRMRDHFAAGDRGKILVPYRGDARGNPVILPRAIVARLLGDPDGPTCRAFIDHNPDLVARYDAPDDHFTTDLDTPADAARLGVVPISNT